MRISMGIRMGLLKLKIHLIVTGYKSNTKGSIMIYVHNNMAKKLLRPKSFIIAKKGFKFNQGFEEGPHWKLENIKEIRQQMFMDW